MSLLKKVEIGLRTVWFWICYHKHNTPKIRGKIYFDNRNATFGKKVVLCRGVHFWGGGTIKIGNNVAIGDNVTIFASKMGGVTIGDNTVIAADSYIIDMNHGYAYGKSAYECEDTCEEVVIGKNVWIGQNVTILKGSVIGDGCVVGAKSLVNKKFPAEVILCGIPAKVIKVKEKG